MPLVFAAGCSTNERDAREPAPPQLPCATTVALGGGTASDAVDVAAAASTSRASLIAAAQAAGIFDASDHTTLELLAIFANGRTHPSTAYGDDIYLMKMDLYTKFVAHQLLAELLRNEHKRLVATTEY